MKLLSVGFALGLSLGLVWAYPEPAGCALYNLSVWLNPELADAADLATEIVAEHKQAVESRARRQ